VGKTAKGKVCAEVPLVISFTIHVYCFKGKSKDAEDSDAASVDSMMMDVDPVGDVSDFHSDEPPPVPKKKTAAKPKKAAATTKKAPAKGKAKKTVVVSKRSELL
jgi:hypothetical protein